MIYIRKSKKQLERSQSLEKLAGVVVFIAVIMKTNKIMFAVFCAFVAWLIMSLINVFINSQKRKELRNSGIQDIDTMDGFQFEHYLVELFKSHKYSAKKTSDRNDFGGDLILTRDGKKIVVQAKRHNSNVGITAVQEVIGAKAYYKADEAWVVTNSNYTKSAATLAENGNVRLLGRDELIKLLNASKKVDGSVSPADLKKEIQSKEKKPCLKCGGEMVLRNSKRGVFYGCRNFPTCRNIENVKK